MYQEVSRCIAVTVKPGALQLVPINLGVVFIFLTFPSSAFAYLDPGSASLFLQLLLSGLAGALIIAKIYWKRFGLFVKGLAKHAERGQNTSTDT